MNSFARRLASLAAMVATIISAVSVAPQRSFDTLAVRADRFFNQKEWASASALYTLMIDQRPDSAALYGRAITAAGMRNEVGEQQMLLRKALQSKVPLDSLFNSVAHSSFALGQSNLLERFLIMSAESEPWMSRKIDAQLLAYYTFRRNGEAMIEYASKLIKGAPDNENFGMRLAEGLLIEGRTDEAASAFRNLLDHHPQSLDALLYLGEIALEQSDTAMARAYLERARDICDSPRLQTILKSF